MKIVIQEPLFLFDDQEKNFNGYNFEFFLKYCDGIYTTSKLRMCRYILQLIRLNINPLRFNFISSIEEVNDFADVLISFSGTPFKKHLNPEPEINVIKIWHIMDYANSPLQTAASLKNGRCDYLLGYARHDLYCEFFKKYYSDYINRVIDVPFGYGKRFSKIIKPKINKVVALGAINRVNDDTFPEVMKFFKNEKYSHPIRAYVRENLQEFSGMIHSKLPSIEQEKNPSISMVSSLSDFNFFLNDLSIYNFPPARTFEGIATGSILVGTKHPVYERLGFINNVNSILLDDFSDRTPLQLHNILNNQLDTKNIRDNSLLLSEDFTHEAVAKNLYQKICSFC